MSSLKKNKQTVENAITSMFDLDKPLEWSAAKHPVATFYVNGKKFTYSVDSTPRAEYTEAKTKKMIKVSLTHKAVQWGYISAPDQFEAVFMKQR